jgi:UDP-N-acetylmuramate dehydrogenase
MTGVDSLLARFRPIIRSREPLSRHTSFRIGGPADAFARPRSVEELVSLLTAARESSVPVFIIGAGANILVSDKGFRGLIVSLARFCTFTIAGTRVEMGAGLPAARAAKKTARAGLQGLERFHAMPGSVGGAVWMNARCYESSFSDCLTAVTVLDQALHVRSLAVDRRVFDYKKSPFQTDGSVILSAVFSLTPAQPRALAAAMREIERDRRAKGHFSHPSAGSVFKNNRDFGEPTGKLLDALDFRGKAVGGAQVSVRHANIIINRRRATAADVKALVARAEQAIKQKYGYTLEREIIYIGDD